MKQEKRTWLIAALALAMGSQTALAQSTASAPTDAAAPTQTSTTSALMKNLREKLGASYTMWITGPTVADIDGQKGDGNNLTLDQFASVKYKVSSKWKIGFTQPWTNKVRSDSEGKRNLNFNNPYITASNSSLTKSEKYDTNLSGYVRYYMPLSRTSEESLGKRVDTKNGVVRIVLDPTKTFLDGKLALSGAVYIHRTFAGAKPAAGVVEQRDWRIYLYPKVSYEVSAKFTPYVAYFNDWEHVRLDQTRQGGGRWQSFNDTHSIELGFDWAPVAGLSVTPYISYGPKFQPRDSSIGLIADYAFL